MKQQNYMAALLIAGFFSFTSLSCREPQLVYPPPVDPGESDPWTTEEFHGRMTVQKNSKTVVILVETNYPPSEYYISEIIVIDENGYVDHIPNYGNPDGGDDGSPISYSVSGKSLRIVVDVALVKKYWVIDLMNCTVKGVSLFNNNTVKRVCEYYY